MSRPLVRISVTTAAPAEGYEIVIGPGVRGQLPSLVERRCAAHRYAVITDDHVERLYGAWLLRAMRAAGHRADVFAFPYGEARKSRETWSAVTDAMLESEMGRDSAVVALGGGVVGDLAGFVAATYMRGLPVVQVPTTLLAMIDASVGGKTGVNTPAGKNLVGAFWPPRLVIIDPELVATLPAAHRRAGLAEAVKHAAIADADHLRRIAETSSELLEAEPDVLCEIITRSIEIKSEIVSSDEREAGPRRALNFGHTVAHALEAAVGYRMLHGEAVAIGMVTEARIGERSGVTVAGTAAALRDVLRALGLPVSMPKDVSAGRILELARGDKKAREGRTEFVLLRAVGEVHPNGGRWSHTVPDEAVLSVLEETT
jgi:3-dehydroquinate synthase